MVVQVESESISGILRAGLHATVSMVDTCCNLAFGRNIACSVASCDQPFKPKVERALLSMVTILSYSSFYFRDNTSTRSRSRGRSNQTTLLKYLDKGQVYTNYDQWKESRHFPACSAGNQQHQKRPRWKNVRASKSNDESIFWQRYSELRVASY